jgi:hypothetical protein
MPTTHDKRQIEQMQALVQKKLNARRDLAGQLNVVGSMQDEDGWLYFVVSPAKAGVRAYDYAKALSDVQLELRDEGIEQVLLAPEMPD